MTYDEFLESLATTKDQFNWFTYDTTTAMMIRTYDEDNNPLCPITAVHTMITGKTVFKMPNQYKKAANALQLDDVMAYKIMDAADASYIKLYDRNIRKDLLNAVGLIDQLINL